jgi:hypothetical protein
MFLIGRQRRRHPSPYAPQRDGHSTFCQVRASHRIGLRSRERKPDSCCGHPALTSNKPPRPGLMLHTVTRRAASFSVTRCRTPSDSCPKCRPRHRAAAAGDTGGPGDSRPPGQRSGNGNAKGAPRPAALPSPAADRESHSESQRGTASGDRQPHRAATWAGQVPSEPRWATPSDTPKVTGGQGVAGSNPAVPTQVRGHFWSPRRGLLAWMGAQMGAHFATHTLGGCTPSAGPARQRPPAAAARSRLPAGWDNPHRLAPCLAQPFGKRNLRPA